MLRNFPKYSVVAMLVIAFVVSGCQSPNNKWSTALKERAKPKPKFQGLDEAEEVTYWPYKADKSNQKMSALPSQLKGKMARKTEESKKETQLKELIAQGDQLRKNQQFDDARIAYSQALLASPDSPEVHHRLAIIADKQQQYSIADEHYQAAIRLQPRNVNLMADMGYSYWLRGNLQQAEQTLKQALEIDKSHQGAMANLGAVYGQQNRRDEAMAMFRAGASEATAQRYFANLFPQDRTGSTLPSIASAAPSHAGPALSTSPAEDLSKLSFQEVRARMARLAEEEKRRRYEADQITAQREQMRMRELSANQEIAGQTPGRPLSANMGLPNGNPYNGTTALNSHGEDEWGNPVNPPADLTQRPNVMMPSHTSRPQSGPTILADSAPQNGSKFEVLRGRSLQLQPGLTTDAQNQQYAAPQMNPTSGNNPSMAGGASSAGQFATQLAMSAGPGSMFPMMSNSGTDGVPTADPSASYSNRFGSEFQQPPSYQNPQGWSGAPIEQTGGAVPADGTKFDGAPSIAPSSPANNWSSPTSATLNWQGGSSGTPSWANDSPNSGAAGTGFDSGAGQLVRPEAADRASAPPDRFDAAMQSRMSLGNDPTRPYNGSWPSSNSLPSNQSQAVQAEARYPAAQEGKVIPLTGGMGADPSIQSGTRSSSSNTLPMWKYAPNR